MVSLSNLQNIKNLFSKELLNEISENGKLMNFTKDEIIIDINQKLEYVPILTTGNIKVLREDDQGNDFLLYVLESGDTCAMSLTCCISSKTSKIRAIADKPTQVVMISIDNMQSWMSTYEEWRIFILQSYQTRFDEMLEAIDTLAFMKMDERLYKYLKNMAMVDESKTISIKHQDIAEDLNTSRVVVSRLLKKLENENKIELGRNKIVII